VCLTSLFPCDLFCALSRGLVYISNANPACSCVYICKFQFRPIHPPSRRLSPIFNELPRHALEPPHMAQNLNYLVGPSAYNDGRSANNHGRSEYMFGQSAHEFFEEDCYLNPHSSQQHFPSHYAMHQPINTKS
jgi:hypothetical protein